MDRRIDLIRRLILIFVVLAGLAMLLGLAGLYLNLYPLQLIAGLLLVAFGPGCGLLSSTPTPSSPLGWLTWGFTGVLGGTGRGVDDVSETEQAVIEEIQYLYYTLQLQPACIVRAT